MNTDRITQELAGPEIQRRVDAWLRSRPDFDQRLASEWREVTAVFGAGSNAALGCLLALWWQVWPATSLDRASQSAGIQDAIAEGDREALSKLLIAALERAPEVQP